MQSRHAVDLRLGSDLPPNPEHDPPEFEQRFSTLVHKLNNKLGVILTRCELMTTRSDLDGKSVTDLRAIHDAAESIVSMLRTKEYLEGKLKVTAPRRGSNG